jgi:hypothetical protein
MSLLGRRVIVMKRKTFIWGAALTGIVLSYGHIASAQTVNDASRKEIADQKTVEAKQQFDEHNVSAACRLYEVADQLDPSPLRKADFYGCLEKLGQYTSAAEHWRKVAETLSGQDADYALEQAKRLEADAPCIIVDVPNNLQEILNLEVAVDGRAIPKVSWGKACTPVNMGEHTITAKAPNKGWAQQKHSTMAPQTQYRVTITKPIWEEKPKVIPTKSENPVPLIGFIAPMLVFSLVGGVAALSLNVDDSNDMKTIKSATAYTFLGAAAGTLTSGIVVYVLAKPKPSDSGNQTEVSGMSIGVMGRF